MPTVQEFDKKVAACKDFRSRARYSTPQPPCEETVAKELGMTRDEIIKRDTKKENDKVRKAVAPPKEEGPGKPPPRPIAPKPKPTPAVEPPKETSGVQKVVIWLAIGILAYAGFKLFFPKKIK